MQKKTLPRIVDCSELEGKYVLVRASLNVPVRDGVVQNQFRIVRALPTINFLRKAGARVILIAHIGREPHETLAPVAEAMNVSVPVTFVPAITGRAVTDARAAMQNGDVIMLENVRQHPHEKHDDGSFAAELAALADVYVNDAFAASHRTHTSLVGVAERLPSYFGLNFMHEYDELTVAMQPKDPALFILGGAKFETKMPLVEKYLGTYDTIFIGGALANDIYKARGYEVGESLVSEVDLSNSPLIAHDRIMVPVDVVVDGPDGRRTCRPEAVQANERILDAGPETIALLSPIVQAAATILWNGPLGNYEAGYGEQTESLAHCIAQASGYAVVGGGDTIAAIETLRVQECIGFMSTAGGAMLTFLEAGTLPAIDAVLNQ